MTEIPKKYTIDNAKNDIQNLQSQNSYDFQEIKRLDELIKDYEKRVLQSINFNNQINKKIQYNYENLKKTALDRIKYLEDELSTGSGGSGLTISQTNKLNEAYTHSQSYHTSKQEIQSLNNNVNTINNNLNTHINSIHLSQTDVENTVKKLMRDLGESTVNTNINVVIPGFTPSETIYEFEDVANTWMMGTDNKTLDITSTQFLGDWYDIYVGSHDDGMVVTKNYIGNDTTNTYGIYEYDFKPKNYIRTILLTSGLHAYECSSQFGLAHFFKDLMTTPYKHNGFKYIRENVRIKVIPILNPWGYNQSPKVYANVNGVNANRNFNFNGSWEAYPDKPGDEWNYKGTSAFSEQETKNIANWLYYNKDIAEFWIDCHTGYNDSSHDIWNLYQSYSPLKNKILSAITKIENHIKSKYSVDRVSTYSQVDYVNSIKIEWSEKVVGIPMMVLEQSPLNRKWCKSGERNNCGGAIREYATQLYMFIQEFLEIEETQYDIIDYISKLRDMIFNNTCKQIPFYNSATYSILNNASSVTSTPSPDNPYLSLSLYANNGSCSSTDGSISSSTTRAFTDFIEVNTTTFNVTKNSSNFMHIARYFDSNKNFLSSSGGSFSLTVNYSLPTNTKYVVLQLKKSDDSVITESDFTGTITGNNIDYNLQYNSSLILGSSSTTTATLQTINAEYTQGSTVVYTSTSLNSLKSNLVVTGNYDDGSTKTITNYSLSGTLKVGTSTITVSYLEKTTTFSVNVSELYSNSIECRNVSIASADGTETISNTRITTDYIPVNIDGNIDIVCSNDLYYTVRAYDSDKKYIGSPSGTWYTGTGTLVSTIDVSTISYLRIVFKDGTAGTNSINSISGTIKIENDGINKSLIMSDH